MNVCFVDSMKLRGEAGGGEGGVDDPRRNRFDRSFDGTDGGQATPGHWGRMGEDPEYINK